MPRRRQQPAIPGDAPTKTPEPESGKLQSRKPRRKRPAGATKAASPARKRTKPKSKARRQALFVTPQLLLPAPCRVPLLTYVPDAHRIGAGARIICLPYVVTGPCAPPTLDAVPQNEHASGGAQSTAPAIPTAPKDVAPASPAPIAAGRRRTYARQAQTVAKIGITAAIIGAVVLLARVAPVKPNAAVLTYASPPVQTALVHDGGGRTGGGLYAIAEGKLAHHPSAAKWTRAKWGRRVAARVRIIDAPARTEQSCGEQTWPYIADYCLTVAEDHATPAPAGAVTPIAVPVAVLRDAADAPTSHAEMAPAAIDVPPALTLDAGHAAGGPDTDNSGIERISYRTAALSDDTAANMENQKAEPAPPHRYQTRREEPARASARPRQASPAAARAAAMRYALQLRRQAPRYAAWARPRQWPARRFAGPAYGIRPYASAQSAFYAPWY
jgi:hypothetical protein